MIAGAGLGLAAGAASVLAPRARAAERKSLRRVLDLANLAELPPAGATLVVGGPEINGASGGPGRVLALL
jgi:hypothetical protein